MHWLNHYTRHWDWTPESHCAHVVADVLKRVDKTFPALPATDPRKKLAAHRAMRRYLNENATLLPQPELWAVCAIGTQRVISHVGVVVKAAYELRVLHCGEGIPTSIDTIDWLQSTNTKVAFYAV